MDSYGDPYQMDSNNIIEKYMVEVHYTD